MDAIRTIFFDFGNVLAFFDHARASRRLAELARRSEDEIHAVMYSNPRFNDFESGLISSEVYVRRVLAELRWECDPDVFANIFGDIFTPNRPVCDLIPKLAANYRLVLASNSNGLHAADFLPAFAGTLGHFQKLVFSHEVTARKPDAAFYRACQEHACCEPRQCLFVDDRTDNIEAAARHGWNVIHLTSIDKLLRGLARFGVYNDF